MYQDFYGLRESPFELTSDPKYLFLTPRHSEALANLQYGLTAAKAVTVLTGEAGTGKTTLLKTVVDSEPCRHVRHVYLNNPTLTRGEFVEMLAARFALSAEAGRSKAALLGELEPVLLERRSRGLITALIIDEAQSLDARILEEIRLLANIETPSQKLLPLVLVGQPELATRLEEPGLRQLKQRVALRCEILPFTLQETAGYIASRIRTAGGQSSHLFTREAVLLIHEHSRGIPRIVSVICDNALVSGMALRRRPVDSAIVLEVCRDFHIRAKDAAAAPANAGQDDEEAETESPQTPADIARETTVETPAESQPAGPRRFTLFGTTLR